MPEATVGVRLRTEGAEQTLAQLEQVRSRIARVSDAQVTHAKEMNIAGRQARQLNSVQAQQTQIFLAQHPAINSLSRAMSTYASISRGVLAVTSAFSLAMIAFNTSNSRLTELQANLREVERQMALTTDPEKMRELADEAGVLKEQIKEVNDQVEQAKINNMLNFAAAIGIVGSSTLSAATSIAPALASGGALSNLLAWAGGMAVLGPALAFAAGAIGGIMLFEATKGEDFKPWIMDLSNWDKFYEALFATNLYFADIFLVQIPAALAATSLAFQGFWSGVVQFATNAANAILRTVEFMVNSAIDAINGLIKGANLIAGAIGLPKIGLIGNVSLGRVGGGGAASAPTAARSSPEVRGPGNFTVNVYNAGSVITENEVGELALRVFKDQLKRLGFTGNNG